MARPPPRNAQWVTSQECRELMRDIAACREAGALTNSQARILIYNRFTDSDWSPRDLRAIANRFDIGRDDPDDITQEEISEFLLGYLNIDEDMLSEDDEDEPDDLDALDDEDEPVAGRVEFAATQASPADTTEDITLSEIIKMLDDFRAADVMRLIMQKYPPILQVMAAETRKSAAYQDMLIETCTALHVAGLPIPETVNVFWREHQAESIAKHEAERAALERVIQRGEDARRKLRKLRGETEDAPAARPGKVVRKIVIPSGR